jgi:hypothetical protein
LPAQNPDKVYKLRVECVEHYEVVADGFDYQKFTCKFIEVKDVEG